MKQRIPLIPYNKKILTTKYNISPEQLTTEYWIHYIMNNKEIIARILDAGTENIEKRIHRRAKKLMKEHIRRTVGLPKTSGPICRQRKYAAILKKTGLYYGQAKA